MRPISQKIRKTFKQEKCFCCPAIATERHHALNFAGRQLDEPYAIIPLRTKCHRGNNGAIYQDVRERCELKAISAGIEHLKANYPKGQWEKRMIYLSLKK